MSQPGKPVPATVADFGAFLVRLLRFDPAGLVRLRPAAAGVVTLWARLPFDVLVTRPVRSDVTVDATVRAADLLAAVERGEVPATDGDLPPRHDLAWRSALPPSAGDVVEQVPTGEVRRIAEAAAETLRKAAGSVAVGERRLRDELLDHVALIVTQGETRHDIPVRLVQGAVRMGFLGPDDEVPTRIRHVAGWLAIEARYGTAWYRRVPGIGLAINPH